MRWLCKKSNFYVALHLAVTATYCKVRLVTRDSRALNLTLFTLPSNLRFF